MVNVASEGGILIPDMGMPFVVPTPPPFSETPLAIEITVPPRHDELHYQDSLECFPQEEECTSMPPLWHVQSSDMPFPSSPNNQMLKEPNSDDSWRSVSIHGDTPDGAIFIAVNVISGQRAVMLESKIVPVVSSRLRVHTVTDRFAVAVYDMQLSDTRHVVVHTPIVGRRYSGLFHVVEVVDADGKTVQIIAADGCFSSHGTAILGTLGEDEAANPERFVRVDGADGISFSAMRVMLQYLLIWKDGTRQYYGEMQYA